MTTTHDDHRRSDDGGSGDGTGRGGAVDGFEPMPRRSTGILSRTMSRFSDAVADIEAQREPHAAFWDQWNERTVGETGPLWVALGDSTSQGIGAADPYDGWIPRMLERVRDHTGEPWRVINLSITGAQLSDILSIQLPRITELRSRGHEPAIVTHLAGANDMISFKKWPTSIGNMRRVLDSLPSHSVVARVGDPFPKGGFMARRVNQLIERQAAERPFHLFWPWMWPSRDGLAGDKWHPGPLGYGYMVDLIWEPMVEALERKQ